MASVIVTGGAGYVGSHTVLLLKQQGYDVTVIDDLRNGHLEAVEACGATFKEVKLDDKEAVAGIFMEVNPVAVVDFAAYLDVGESQREPEKYVQNNLLCFQNVLDAMVASGCKLIIKSSTQATYGNAKEEFMPLVESYCTVLEDQDPARIYEEPQCERGTWGGDEVDGPTMFNNFVAGYAALEGAEALTAAEKRLLHTPFSIYGLSKLLDEVMLSKYEAKHGLRWVSLRYGNVCGADPGGLIGEAKKRPHTLMTLAIHTLLGRRANFLSVFGTAYPTPDGTTIRDYVHPSDLADGHLSALRYLEAGKASNCINLGTGTGSSVKEVIGAVEKAAGEPIELREEPARLGDTTLSQLSIAKAKEILQYEPKFDLDGMASTAWKWHNQLQDPDWQEGFKKA